ncbi:hypothetical protein FQA47_009508 [Oryzias melastigma]|uniref:Uncharacterized protein n=1 Tax=Oryzias melastigma TaxID=30732 RepID=A0A834CIA1_ORYME|nr:hypothetical protein FQA47_009508 [Oryzias melastigma]
MQTRPSILQLLLTVQEYWFHMKAPAHHKQKTPKQSHEKWFQIANPEEAAIPHSSLWSCRSAPSFTPPVSNQDHIGASCAKTVGSNPMQTVKKTNKKLLVLIFGGQSSATPLLQGVQADSSAPCWFCAGFVPL